jgi:predicted RNase H-like nuclease (RuvC/YqgF family)
MAPIKTLASQAKSINSYKNLRTKVMKCCANIYFTRQCLIKKVIPKYAKIKIPYTSPATNITQKKTQIMRLKDEIKFLYMKKEKLKNELYRIQLKAAHEWGNTLYTILDSIHESINQELGRKYKTIEEKLKKKIVHTQTKSRQRGKLIFKSSIKPT